MSIDSTYKPLYQQARDLQYKFHDFVGDTNHPTAHVLRNEIQHLVDDIEVRKNPRDLENRIKVIQRQMFEAQNQGTRLMNYEHHDYLHDNYERMRQDVRRFGNYS